jgi:hypothetical protein
MTDEQWYTGSVGQTLMVCEQIELPAGSYAVFPMDLICLGTQTGTWC